MKKLITYFFLGVLLSHNGFSQFNYAEGLQKSLFFYEVQRAGVMLGENRVAWRGDSHLNDGKDMGWDLTGGWYDAGDNVKWNVSMAFAGSTLALSAMEYKNGYVNTGQMPYLINNLRWVSEYFVKCLHYTSETDLSSYKIVVDIGAGGPDHGHWASSEVAHLLVSDRKTYYADKDYPNTGTVAAMAGTLAASAWVMRDNGQATHADNYIAAAEKMYKFAKTYRTTDDNRDKSKDSQGNVVNIVGYGSSRDFDELTWAAACLHKAQKQKSASYPDTYLNDAKTLAATIMWADPWDSPHSHYQMGNYHLYSYFMLAKLVPTDDQYITRVARDAKCFASITCPGQPLYAVSPGGLSKINHEWGTLRHVNNAAFITFLYADMATNEPDKDKLISWAISQLDYSLGKNPLNLSFMAGYAPAGKISVTSAHHRTAHAPWAGFEHLISGKPEFNNTKTRHTFYGALLGGPNWNDEFTPNIGDAKQNEVALDYQAGFTGNLARMAQFAPGGSVLSNFPPQEQKEDEYFVEAKVNSTGSDFTEVRALLNNRSAWPAIARKNMSFRYFFTPESGTTVSATLTSSEGAKITGPTLCGGNVYYVTVEFANVDIFPGGLNGNNNWMPYYRKEAVFKISSSGSWDASNDFSFYGLANTSQDIAKTLKMPVYDNGVKLAGEESSCLLTAVEEADAFNQLQLSPNPAGEIVNITNAAFAGSDVNISIVDIFSSERIAKKFNHSGETISVNISSLENGIYHVVVVSGNKKTVRKLVVAK